MKKLLLACLLVCTTSFALTPAEMKEIETQLSVSVDKAMKDKNYGTVPPDMRPKLTTPGPAFRTAGENVWRFGKWLMSEPNKSEVVLESTLDENLTFRVSAYVKMKKIKGHWVAEAPTSTTHHATK